VNFIRFLETLLNLNVLKILIVLRDVFLSGLILDPVFFEEISRPSIRPVRKLDQTEYSDGMLTTGAFLHKVNGF